ncbi:MAG: VanZ family protein [Clostridia bacterium]|nr:VanZ family protein [Clostridia bacterium]
MDLVTGISVFVLLAALLLPFLAHVLRRHPRWLAAAKYVILGVYILANLYETILFRAVQPNRRAEWELLWSYRASLAFPDGLMSLLNGSVEVTMPSLLEEIILNILLYIPMGYLLPFTFKRLKAWHVVLIALLCSVVTEVSQLVFRIGWFEYDDMLNNTMGCVLGLILYGLLMRRPVRKGAQV